MIENEINVTTQDGEMNTFFVHPDEGGPHPVVILNEDAPGWREELRDMARRIASCGYFVALPDMYYRTGFHLNIDDPALVAEFTERMDRVNKLMGTLNNGRIAEDTAALLDHIAGMDAAKDGKAGLVGYCMSGPFVAYNAAVMADRIACAASIHGVKLMTDDEDSPHRHVEKVTGELYFGCAEHDLHIDDAQIHGIEARMKELGTNARVEWYPGCHHGFVFPSRDLYEKAASEQHWQRIIDLFRRNLG
jgi:carboxymethylenebutenolidase